MRPKNAEAVRQAKAADKAHNLPDTDGLGLVVAPTGGKSWHLRYYWLGKQKRNSLGNYPEVGLREARSLRDEARALLAKGINPHTDRKQKRHAVKLASDYNHADYVEQRRMMMQDRADRLDSCERGEPIARPALPQAAPHSMAEIESYLRLLAQGRLPQPVDGVALQRHSVS